MEKNYIIDLTVLTILSDVKPYSLNNSSGFPLCPKISFIPIFFTNEWWFSHITSETAEPSPPTTLCSSTVTIFPVSFAALRMISVSIGFMVWRLITLTLIPSAFNF